MVVGQLLVMEQADVELFVVDEAHVDERIVKLVATHGEIVED